MRLLLPAVAVLFLSFAAFGQTMIFSRGSLWRYTDSPPPSNWTQQEFDDSNWAEDEAQFGYGEFDEAALLPANGNPVYFRKSFTIANLADFRTLTLKLVADDAAIIHLNGGEVARYNLTNGLIHASSPPLTNLEDDENSFRKLGILTNRLRAGLNVLSVELRQHPAGRSDASFDAELIANLSEQAPSLRFVSPTNRTMTGIAPIDIVLEVSEPTGHFERIDLFANGERIYSFFGEPFQVQWNPPNAGRYTLFARGRTYRSVYVETAPIQISHGAEGNGVLKHEPYLQSCTTTGIVIRWNTDWFTDSVVRFGTTPGSLTNTIASPASVTAHELQLTGLSPGTTYWYSIGTTAATLARGPNHWFKTTPTNNRPTRIWVVGDSGSRDINAVNVRDAYYDTAGSDGTDLMIMLGDNSYGNGTLNDYETDVFAMYGSLLRQTTVWPTLGNHDVGDSSSQPYMSAYLDSFTLPTRGEAGGTPSGTELYYSFDHANIHFICLDSYVSSRQPGSTMLRWLEDDLSSTTKDWIIAFWHHPPYSKGSHDSDNDPWQTEMRQFVLPILEAYGVDLVLCGHSHSYERSFLINGHYGFSATLQPEMILQQHNGDPAISGPYRKPAGGLGSHNGTVYAVCGCSGQGGNSPFSRVHPVMATSLGDWGSMAIEVDDLKLSAKFIRHSQAIDDPFVIDKSAPPVVAPRLASNRDAGTPLLSWPTSRPTFTLEQSADPAATVWTPFLGASWTQGRQYFARPDTNAPHQFFRLRSQPAP